MEKTITITLADGTKLENLRLNGNNFISEEKIEDEIFEGTLGKVEIYDSETEQTTTMRDAVLIQNEQYGDEYWFILAEKSQEEKDRESMLEDLEVQAQAIEELATIVSELL